MNKSLTCASLFFAACFSITAYANIGETDAQMEARYGASQAQEKNAMDGLVTKCYAHDGLWIRARFLDGSSQSEAFIKLDKSPLSEGEINTLLASNNRGGKWTSVYKSADGERWVLDSNTAVAQYYGKDHLLLITTKELRKFVDEKSRLDEKP